MKAIMLGGVAALAAGSGGEPARAQVFGEAAAAPLRNYGELSDERLWTFGTAIFDPVLRDASGQERIAERPGAIWRFEMRAPEPDWTGRPSRDNVSAAPRDVFRGRVTAAHFFSSGAFGDLHLSYKGGAVAQRGAMVVSGCDLVAVSFAGEGGREVPGCQAFVGAAAPFHQRRFERVWQGRAEASRDLGERASLRFGFGYERTRRLFNEAGAAQPGAVLQRGGMALPFDADPFGDFRMRQKVFSVHGGALVALGSITVSAGGVYDRTALRIRSFGLVDGGALSFDPLDRRRGFGDFLPHFDLALKPAADVALHATWQRRVDRPEFVELSPGGILLRGTSRLLLGNPDLARSHGDAFDFAGSWSYAAGGDLGGGLFARMERDPVFVSASVQTESDGSLTVFQPANARSGRIMGMEAHWQQDFALVHRSLSGFGLRFSARYTDSRLRLADGSLSRFPYESRMNWGATLSGRRGRFSGAISWLAGSPALLAIGDGVAGGAGKAAPCRLDVSGSAAVLPGVKLFLEGRNLTDEPVRLYSGAMRDWSIPNDRYGRTIFGGVQASF